MSTEKPMSRQRKWQLKKLATGLCELCGKKPISTTYHCVDCAEKQRTRRRNNYRLKHGIPLDAGLHEFYGRKK